MLADIVNGNDVGMIQAGNDLRFATETEQIDRTCERPSKKQLQRDEAMQLAVARFVDDAHATLGDFFEDFVVADDADSFVDSECFGCVGSLILNAGIDKVLASRLNDRAQRGGKLIEAILALEEVA